MLSHTACTGVRRQHQEVITCSETAICRSWCGPSQAGCALWHTRLHTLATGAAGPTAASWHTGRALCAGQCCKPTVLPLCVQAVCKVAIFLLYTAGCLLNRTAVCAPVCARAPVQPACSACSAQSKGLSMLSAQRVSVLQLVYRCGAAHTRCKQAVVEKDDNVGLLLPVCLQVC